MNDDLLGLGYPHDSMTDPRRRVSPPEPELGSDLGEPVPLGVGPAWDVTVSGEHLISVGPLGLHVMHPDGGRVGRLRGLPVLRQVAVEDGLVAMSARHAGVLLADVTEPRRPRLLSIYDSVELATGVALRDGMLAITNRHYGVELVDVADPRHPRFLASIVTGEAQSVTIDGTLAYVGNWLDQTLGVIDIADPRAPQLLARLPLDGFGDGVAIRGDVCAVATGHHDRQQTDPRHWDGAAFVTDWMLSGGYGGGHGVELWSTRRAREPQLLSRLKNPRLFVGSPDTWRVIWAGSRLVSADAQNGVFVIDADDPHAPRHVGFSLLPRMNDPGASSPRIQPLRHAATGVATVGTSLYVASPSWELGVIDGALDPTDAPTVREQIVVSGPAVLQPHAPVAARRVRAASGDTGHVNEVSRLDRYTVVAACGEQGIALLDQSDLQVLDRQPAIGLVHHVVPVAGLLYASMGTGGLGIYAFEDRRLHHVRAADLGGVVRQLVPVDDGVALALVEGSTVAVIDLGDPLAPSVVDSVTLEGQIYGRILPEGHYDGQLVAAVSLAGGVTWLRLETPTPMAGRVVASTGRRLCPITEGVTQLSSSAALVVLDGGYQLLAPGSDQLAADDDVTRPAGPRLSGVPTAIGKALVVTNRASGGVRILDISEIGRPRELWSGRVDGNPGKPLLVASGLLMPCGRAGLQRLPLAPEILAHLNSQD